MRGQYLLPQPLIYSQRWRGIFPPCPKGEKHWTITSSCLLHALPPPPNSTLTLPHQRSGLYENGVKVVTLLICSVYGVLYVAYMESLCELEKGAPSRWTKCKRHPVWKSEF